MPSLGVVPTGILDDRDIAVTDLPRFDNKLPDTGQEDAIPAARADDFSANDVVKVRSSSDGVFPYSLFNWSNPIDFEQRLNGLAHGLRSRSAALNAAIRSWWLCVRSISSQPLSN